MTRRKKDKSELREEALRPCPYLGYDRDSVAMHLVSHGVYQIAESQLRRAVWLNPFEYKFKQHLAWCLYKDSRYAEAMDWIQKALEQNPSDSNSQAIMELIEKHLSNASNSSEEE